MREAAVMGEGESAPTKPSENVEIGSLGRKCKRQRGERCFSVQPGASHAGAEQEMSNRFQSIRRILVRR